MYCQACGAPNADDNLHCTECGRLLAPRQPGADGSVRGNPPQQPPNPGHAMQHRPNNYMTHYQSKSRLGAGLLQLLLPIGIGRMYMGYTSIGIAQFLTAVFCGVGVIWAFVDGILILTGSPQLDGNGMPMKD